MKKDITGWRGYITAEQAEADTKAADSNEHPSWRELREALSRESAHTTEQLASKMQQKRVLEWAIIEKQDMERRNGGRSISVDEFFASNEDDADAYKKKHGEDLGESDESLRMQRALSTPAFAQATFDMNNMEADEFGVDIWGEGQFISFKWSVVPEMAKWLQTQYDVHLKRALKTKSDGPKE